MSTLNHKNGHRTEKLLQTVATLSPKELENFVSQAIVLRAKKNAPNVSKVEAELLSKINKGLSPKVQKRFDELAEKVNSEMVSPKEREEFLKLTDKIEKQDAKRIELLGKLAEVRQITLDDLMKDLEISKN